MLSLLVLACWVLHIKSIADACGLSHCLLQAAQKAATLKQQRTTLQNEIYKIARKDV